MITAIWIDAFDTSKLGNVLMRCTAAAFAGLCWSTAGSLLPAVLRKEKLRLLFALLGAALGAVPAYLWAEESRILIGLIFSSVPVCMYLCSLGEDNRPLCLGRAILALLAAFALSVLIFGILYLLSGAVTVLLVRNSLSFEVQAGLNETYLCLAFLLAAPLLLFLLLPEPDAPVSGEEKGLARLLAWVILPACLLLLGVLLVYLASIVIRRELPVGQINPYAMLALGAFTALYLLLTGEENRLSAWFIRWGAWLLLPVIAMQAVAVWIRIDAYGLTAPRILGIAFTAVCLIAVISGLWRRRAWCLLPVAALLILLLTVTPLNAWSLARMDQEGRLSASLQRAGLLNEAGQVVPRPDTPEAEQRIIASTLDALRDDPDLPDDSQAAAVLRQIDDASKADNAGYCRGFQAVFGFDIPLTGDQTVSRTAKGSASRTELDVAGFSHARFFTVTLDSTNSFTLEIGNQTVSLEELLPLADFEKEQLLQEELPLADGAVLRICSFTVYLSGNDPIRYYLTAWLLTP